MVFHNDNPPASLSKVYFKSSAGSREVFTFENHWFTNKCCVSSRIMLKSTNPVISKQIFYVGLSEFITDDDDDDDREKSVKINFLDIPICK